MYLSNIGGVFMIEQQQKLMLSPYMEIYELEGRTFCEVDGCLAVFGQ